MGHGTVTPFPKLVQDGIPLTSLSSSAPMALTVYRFEVPTSVSTIKLTTTGGTGDCDLYVRKDAHPEIEDSLYSHSSSGPSSTESITINAPQPGVWYVGLYSKESYTGVRLSLVTTLLPGSIPLPRFLPGSGIFGGRAAITLKSPLSGASILYTLDGSEPGLLSPIAKNPITITADTTVKARLKTRSGALGPFAVSEYVVHSENEIEDLQSGISQDHLCGSNGSRRYFRISVPAGNTLTVQAEGGAGNTSLQVRYGAPPTARAATSSDSIWTGSKKIELKNVRAGDYYILLQGRGNFSDRSIIAASTSVLPDLIAWAPPIRPYITNESFAADSCEVVEGMISAGRHRLLRFNTESRNIGGADVVLPSPAGNPNFEYQACHGHYHFKGFASYRLLDKDHNVAQVGKKVSFCLLDVLRWNSSAARSTRFTCSSQGIQAGWSDIYDSGLPGQWVELDGLLPGNYQLEITMNPSHIIAEGDYSNNVTTVPVVITAP